MNYIVLLNTNMATASTQKMDHPSITAFVNMDRFFVTFTLFLVHQFCELLIYTDMEFMREILPQHKGRLHFVKICGQYITAK